VQFVPGSESVTEAPVVPQGTESIPVTMLPLPAWKIGLEKLSRLLPERVARPVKPVLFVTSSEKEYWQVDASVPEQETCGLTPHDCIELCADMSTPTSSNTTNKPTIAILK
jgi:hypothetical protein